MTKITLIASGVLLVALIVLGKLYLNKSNALAVEEERTQGLVASYEMLSNIYQEDQRKIAERDQAFQELSKINRGLRHDLDQNLAKDPSSAQWLVSPTPEPVRNFVQQSQRAAVEMSGAGRSPEGTDPDPPG